MYRYFGELLAYDLFNMLSTYALIVSGLFFWKSRRESMGMLSKCVVKCIFGRNEKTKKIIEYILVIFEMICIAYVIDIASLFNRDFGDAIGTGANYFAEFIMIPILSCVVSIILIANPLKQLDIAMTIAPIQLIFFKLACFFEGCCWGIEWQYGLYNHHPNHPGYQVPVQAIEILCAIIIFIILFFYRKKAKTGTIYPIYVILYSATRFPIEFLSAAHETVIGPFNRYHILCAIGVVFGLVLLLILNKYGEKISDFFDEKYNQIDKKIAKNKEIREEKIAEENARIEAEKLERREKAKAARAKASVKYKK